MVRMLINRYNNMHIALKASIWFAICSALQKGIALLTTPIFTRLLTTDQYGQYTVYQSWYSIISIIATLNLYYSTTYNGLTKYPEEKTSFVSSMQGLCTIITGILFIIYMVFSGFWNDLFTLDSIYMYAMFLELLFVPAYNFWMANERYEYRYRKIIVTSLIISVSSPLIAILAILNTEYKAEARVISYVMVQVCVGLIIYIINFAKGRTFFSRKFWKYALSLNLPLLPHYLSSVVLNESDRLMINNMVGKGSAAIYSVAYTIAMLMTIVVTAINNTLTPYIYKSLKSGECSGIKKISYILIAFIAVMCLVTVSFGPEIIRIFAAEEYYDAIWVIPPVATSVYFCFLYPLFSTIEFYYEKTTYIMVASMCAAIANILLNYVFIPVFGYYAAGYTTLICYIIYSFVHYLFSIKILRENKMPKLFNAKCIIVTSCVVLGVMFLSTLLYRFQIIRLIMGVLEILIAIGLSIYIKKGKNTNEKP